MSPHLLAQLAVQPLDSAHSFVALLIGVAGGCLVAGIRLKPLRRALAAKRAQPPKSTDGPWS